LIVDQVGGDPSGITGRDLEVDVTQLVRSFRLEKADWSQALGNVQDGGDERPQENRQAVAIGGQAAEGVNSIQGVVGAAQLLDSPLVGDGRVNRPGPDPLIERLDPGAVGRGPAIGGKDFLSGLADEGRMRGESAGAPDAVRDVAQDLGDPGLPLGIVDVVVGKPGEREAPRLAARL